MKVYTANITVCGSTVAASDYGRKKHPKKQFYESTEETSTHKNTQAGSRYTQRQLGSFYSIRF